MHSAISMNKTEVLDSVLNDFSEVSLLSVINIYIYLNYNIFG